MNNLDLTEEFAKIERRIKNSIQQGRDTKHLLKSKIRILYAYYDKIDSAIDEGLLKPIAPIFARKLACLNNIKQILLELDNSTVEVDEKINNLYKDMEKNGFAWILKNLPEAKK